MIKNKANIGCGMRDFGKDWLHVDGNMSPHLDGTDIFNLPCEDASLDLCYSSHLIAYLEDYELHAALNHWRTKLKHGGTLRLATPDFAAMAAYYAKGAGRVIDFFGPIFGFMYMGEKKIHHKQFFDFGYLQHCLYRAGFAYCKEYDWSTTEHADFDDHSKAHLPHSPQNIASNYWPKDKFTLISLNVECIKP